MKKVTILSLAAVASMACFAEDVQTSNAFGALDVTEANTYKLISVPWVAPSAEAGDSAVDIATLVNPDQLTTGDKLYVATDRAASSYNVFEIQNNQWKGVATATIDQSGTVSETAATPSGTTVARGNALWLKTSATTFYLVGQKPSSGTVDVTTTAAAQNLIAASSAADKKITEITGTVGATITFPGNTGNAGYYRYGERNSVTGWWKKGDNNTWTAAGDSDVIPAGKGVWYKSVKGETLSL